MTKSPSPSVDEVAERREALLTILRNAVIETAQRVSGRRGPYVFDEAELQGLASELAATAASLVSPPKAGAGEPVAWRTRYTNLASSDNKPTHWSYCDVEPPPDALGRSWHGWECEPLYANHEARGDGVRVTDERVERAETAMRQFLRDRSMYDAGVMQFVGKELARAALEAALPPLGDGRAEIVEAIAKLAESRAAAQSEFQKSAYSRGDDIGGHGHWKAQCELLNLAAAIRSLSNPGGGLS